MNQETEPTMPVGESQNEHLHLLCNTGQRGSIKNILPELQKGGICVEWTRFSLKEMCLFEKNMG